MIFYSGFSLKNDKIFFEEYLNNREYCVSGFSYGSILALKYVIEQLKLGTRVDTIQLFSPAFFQTKSSSFKRKQTKIFTTSRDMYLKLFLKSCFIPYTQKKTEQGNATIEELNELLNYEWNLSDFFYLETKGVKIEIYLGGKDQIIDIKNAREFFLNFGTVTYIKEANHFLQIN